MVRDIRGPQQLGTVPQFLLEARLIQNLCLVGICVVSSPAESQSLLESRVIYGYPHFSRFDKFGGLFYELVHF